ncbi:hypothetical protein RR42_s3056 [Cupriavidus basilensis]|uniref:Uncharacterized protein n=1 Tax=Cupriavidus basilensis TaxID=68895 RepID=A0A0C4YFQ8_9BURK|nr:hypothetical protein RR42_s3056 [Cupriavidus basilensis]
MRGAYVALYGKHHHGCRKYVQEGELLLTRFHWGPLIFLANGRVAAGSRSRGEVRSANVRGAVPLPWQRFGFLGQSFPRSIFCSHAKKAPAAKNPTANTMAG